MKKIISNSRYFDHGCQDWAVVESTPLGWMVVEASSCRSCWQVGHDGDHVYYSVGDIVPDDVVEEDAE